MSAVPGIARAGTGRTASRAGERALLLGNEAIARGALEAGAGFCAGYPGNPSSEIIETLMREAAGRPMHVEWSVNEIVALEAAAGAAFTGMRALVAMKQNGLNVCADFLSALTLTGLDRGGLVVVVCDDPGPLTSSNEEDSRLFAPLLMLPLLEPATPQQAKDMTAWALALSEDRSLPVLLRSVSRLSHGRAGVRLDPLPEEPPPPRAFAPSRPLLGMPAIVAANHLRLHAALDRLGEDGAGDLYNAYRGPESCDLVLVASGLCALYAAEAVAGLGMEGRVGILSLGMLWPFPRRIVLDSLLRSPRVLVVEQTDPFVEEHVKIVHSDNAAALGARAILGKASGHLPATGEIDAGTVAAALVEVLEDGIAAGRGAEGGTAGGVTGGRRGAREWDARAADVLAALPPRDIAFCQACPHRASFWAIKTALALDGREGVVCGDIGCYGLAAGATGFYQLDTLHCMGAGVGVASGLGVLSRLGLAQPVLAVAGDSTFYHACIPALINARVQGADLTLVILDNSTTAMTGFQPHPGSPCTPLHPERAVLPPEDVCRGLGIATQVMDPVDDVRGAASALFDSLQEPGVAVVVFRRACSTWEKRVGRGEGRSAVVRIDRCIGEACGCDRFCARVLGCPGNRWDEVAGRAYIDPDYCDGCGLCADLCPRQAIAVVDAAARQDTRPVTA